MLSAKTLFILNKILTVSCQFKLIPFKWDPVRHRLCVISNRKSLATFYLCSLYMIINTTFVCTTYIWRVRSPSFQVDIRFVVHTMYLATYIFVCILNYTMYTTRYLLAEILTQLYVTTSYIHGRLIYASAL